MSPLGDIRPQVSLHLKAKDASAPVVFGGEIVEICQKVREHKSIYTAAAETGMSYSKAWRIIKETEAALGFPLFAREGCKGSDLTEDGAKLLDAYQSTLEHLEGTAARMLEKAMDDHFGKIDETRREGERA